LKALAERLEAIAPPIEHGEHDAGERTRSVRAIRVLRVSVVQFLLVELRVLCAPMLRLLGFGGALVAVLALGSPAPPKAVHASAPAVIADAPRVAILATAGERTALHVVRAGESLSAPIASFTHREGSVRGALLPDGSVLAAAPHATDRDRSFDGGLWRLSSDRVVWLCDGLLHASRPLVTPDGRVFAVRGRAGAARDERSMRVDELTLDRIDPESGAVDTLHHDQGYLLHIAGWHDGRVLVYRVAPNRADIVAIDATTGTVQMLVDDLPHFARDFSVLDDRLVYRGRHERESRTWVVDVIDLARGTRRRIHESASFALAPHAWPDGAVALSPDQSGLALLGSMDRIRAPLGSGVDVVRALRGRFVALLHTRERAFEFPFLLDRTTGKSHPLPAPGRTRVDIVGFMR
jgi:hypothetical protein